MRGWKWDVTPQKVYLTHDGVRVSWFVPTKLRTNRNAAYMVAFAAAQALSDEEVDELVGRLFH